MRCGVLPTTDNKPRQRGKRGDTLINPRHTEPRLLSIFLFVEGGEGFERMYELMKV